MPYARHACPERAQRMEWIGMFKSILLIPLSAAAALASAEEAPSL